MEKINFKAWLKKPFIKWLVLLLAALLSYGSYRFYKEITMPPPLVYLIPEDYFGPVFVFFGQPDGVDVQPDPLGQAVRVPENGVVKAKFSTKDIPKFSASVRPFHMVSVSKAGERKVLKVFVGPWKNEDDSWSWGYYDEQTKLHQFKMESEKFKDFSYLPRHLLNERMVFNHDGCRHQGFTPHVREVMEGKMSDEEAGAPACGKFLVVSPNEFSKLPDWMWEDVQRAYGSIQEFVDEANERVKKKKEYYKLP